jgi:putative copper resistance protein D
MLILARGIYYAATMILFGGAAFSAGLRARLPVIASLNDRPLRWAALVVALVAGCAWLGLAAMRMADAMDGGVITRTATDTLFGQLFLARMAALLGFGLVLALRRGRWLAPLLAGLALVLPAATSHAALASPAGFTAIGAIIDGLHLLTAGFWLGGLVVLVTLFRRQEPNMLLALSLFSDWALIAVLLLVMSGLIDAASILLGGGAISKAYVAVLALKLALVAGMLVLAGINRFKLMPRADNRGIAHNTVRELGLGVIVVLLAGALGQLEPTL